MLLDDRCIVLESDGGGLAVLVTRIYVTDTHMRTCSCSLTLSLVYMCVRLTHLLGGCASRAAGSTAYRGWVFTGATTATTYSDYGKAKTAKTRFTPPAAATTAARGPRPCRPRQPRPFRTHRKGAAIGQCLLWPSTRYYVRF